MKLYPESSPAWLQKGVRALSTVPSTDPREPAFHCAKPPSQRMMDEIRETLAAAEARSIEDYPDEDHPYAHLSGALQADITMLSNTLETYLKIYGLELMS